MHPIRRALSAVSSSSLLFAHNLPRSGLVRTECPLVPDSLISFLRNSNLVDFNQGGCCVKISEDLATEIVLASEEAKGYEGLIRALYKALAAEADARILVSKLIVPDLDYWFHGPPRQDHMMRLLTGATSCETFRFQPVRFFSHGNNVFVEGTNPTRRNLYWTHIWTLKDGLIVQLREYFNTAVLVTDLKENLPSADLVQNYPCNTVWQSQMWKEKEGKSIPGFVLAI